MDEQKIFEYLRGCLTIRLVSDQFRGEDARVKVSLVLNNPSTGLPEIISEDTCYILIEPRS